MAFSTRLRENCAKIPIALRKKLLSESDCLANQLAKQKSSKAILRNCKTSMKNPWMDYVFKLSASKSRKRTAAQSRIRKYIEIELHKLKIIGNRLTVASKSKLEKGQNF